MHVVFIEPRFPAQPEAVRPGARRDRRDRHRDRRGQQGLARRRAQALAHALRAGRQRRATKPRCSRALRFIQRTTHVDRLEATVEAHIMPTAKVREAAGIPGTSVRTAFLCRDKPAMKEVLREGGVPCAQSTGASTRAPRSRAFAEQVGYPADPQAARRRRRVGRDPRRQRRASSRPRCARSASAARPLASRSRSSSRATRASTTRSTIGGEVVARLRDALLPERARGDAHALDLAAVHRDQPHRQRAGYDELKALGAQGRRSCSASRPRRRTWSGSSGPRASSSPRSAAGRPACARGTSTTSATTWTSTASGRCAVVHGPAEPARVAPLSPRASSRCARIATAASPATRASTRSATRSAEHRSTCHLPPEGTPTQPVDAGYMANAWLRMKHETTTSCARMLDIVGQTVKVRAR